MRPGAHHRRPHDLVRIVDPPLAISLAQTMGTLNLGRAEILTAIQRHRRVRPLVLPTRQRGGEAPAPARPAHFLPELREQRARTDSTSTPSRISRIWVSEGISCTPKIVCKLHRPRFCSIAR